MNPETFIVFIILYAFLPDDPIQKNKPLRITQIANRNINSKLYTHHLARTERERVVKTGLHWCTYNERRKNVRLKPKVGTDSRDSNITSYQLPCILKIIIIFILRVADVVEIGDSLDKNHNQNRLNYIRMKYSYILLSAYLFLLSIYIEDRHLSDRVYILGIIIHNILHVHLRKRWLSNNKINNQNMCTVHAAV